MGLFHCDQNQADDQNANEMIGATDNAIKDGAWYVRVYRDIYCIGKQVSKSNNDSKDQGIFIGINF